MKRYMNVKNQLLSGSALYPCGPLGFESLLLALSARSKVCAPETAFCAESKRPSVLCSTVVTSLANCVYVWRRRGAEGCCWGLKGVLSSPLHRKEAACDLESDCGR